MDYKKETLHAYQHTKRAEQYKKFHTQQLSWGRFVTFLEQRAIRKELSNYNWTASDRLLDIPCGTGVLGSLLNYFPFQIWASDISLEMMELAKGEYPVDRFVEFKQADIINTKFNRDYFSCVITLGFFHRVPLHIKQSSLREIYEITNKIAIVSCSVDTPLQRLKHKVLSLVKNNHVPAPCPVTLKEFVSECRNQGFQVKRSFMLVPLFSSHALFVLQK